ncbi:MAG: hypothetical protein E7293_05430 [Lachnospiraceae bacterium]|nr:hypothetical protein [Lachnospiraceae bacterium]
MKRNLVITIFICILFVLSLSGCGNRFEEYIPAIDSSEAETTQQETSESIMESTMEPTKEDIPESTNIEFVNEELQKLVSRMLGKNSDEPISTMDALELKSLRITDFENNNLSDLIYFDNIEELEIYSDYFEDASFVKEMDNLNKFIITSEHFHDLSTLSGASNLVELRINSYGIDTLNGLQELPELEIFQIQTDVLNDICALQNFTTLKTIRIQSNKLESIGFDLSKLTNMNFLRIDSGVLTDISSLFQISASADREIQVMICSDVLNEDDFKILAELEYQAAVLTNNYESIHFYLSDTQYRSHYSDKMTAHRKNLIAERGNPIKKEIVIHEPSIEVPQTWEELCVDYDGQLIYVPCTLDTLFEYGYTITDDIRLDEILKPGETIKLNLEKENSNAKLFVQIKNESDADVVELAEAPVLYIKIESGLAYEDYNTDALPELYIPTYVDAYVAAHQKNIDDILNKDYYEYHTYLTWYDDDTAIDKYSFDTTCYDSDTIRVTSPNGKAKIKILDFKGYIESVELGAALKSSRGVIKETLINWRN